MAASLLLTRAVYRKYGSSVGLWTMLLLLGSCGMYIAAAAYLPSSFAMYLTMVAMGAWFESNYKVCNNVAEGCGTG